MPDAFVRLLVSDDVYSLRSLRSRRFEEHDASPRKVGCVNCVCVFVHVSQGFCSVANGGNFRFIYFCWEQVGQWYCEIV